MGKNFAKFIMILAVLCVVPIFLVLVANVKAFLNVTFKSKPKYLGEEINIEGDGRRSWD